MRRLITGRLPNKIYPVGQPPSPMSDQLCVGQLSPQWPTVHNSLNDIIRVRTDLAIQGPAGLSAFPVDRVALSPTRGIAHPCWLNTHIGPIS